MHKIEILKGINIDVLTAEAHKLITQQGYLLWQSHVSRGEYGISVILILVQPDVITPQPVEQL